MKRLIFIYALFMGLAVVLLKVVGYRYMIKDLSDELYIGIIAFGFTSLGVWAGLKLTRPNDQKTRDWVDLKSFEDLEISKREYEVLELMSEGLSNNEIATRLFISANTVKTHTSNLYSKLDARRRTEAINNARRAQIIR